MSENCGGEGIGNKKIAQDVVVNGTLGFLLQGSNISVYPGGEEVPVGVAAEATSKLKCLILLLFYYYLYLLFKV